MWPNPQESVDLVTFTEEILNGKLHFLCSVNVEFQMKVLKCPSHYLHWLDLPLREKCPYLKIFCPYFPAVGLNTDQKNSEYGHFLGSVYDISNPYPCN